MHKISDNQWTQFTTSVTVDGTTVVVFLDVSGATVSLEGTKFALTLQDITLDQISNPGSGTILSTR